VECIGTDDKKVPPEENKMKTCKDCKFIKINERFDVETNNSIDRFYCKWHDHHLKVFNPCEEFEQRTTGENDVFDWDHLIYGLTFGLIVGLIVGSILGLIFGFILDSIVGLIDGLIVGLIAGLIFGLIAGLIFGFTDKKQIYKDSNSEEEYYP